MSAFTALQFVKVYDGEYTITTSEGITISVVECNDGLWTVSCFELENANLTDTLFKTKKAAFDYLEGMHCAGLLLLSKLDPENA